MATSTVALITGAHRGIGLETARQLLRLGWTVCATVRKESDISGVVDALKAEEKIKGGKAFGLALDVTNPDQVASAPARFSTILKENHRGSSSSSSSSSLSSARLDVLVNNAGIFPLREPSFDKTDLVAAHSAFEVNLFGPWRMMQAFLPLLKNSSHARIVNVSSSLGSLTTLSDGYGTSYKTTKSALNMLTKSAALSLKGVALVNAIHPGWVQTDMGGPRATKKLQDGAASVVWGCTLPKDGPTGGFFEDGKPIPW